MVKVTEAVLVLIYLIPLSWRLQMAMMVILLCVLPIIVKSQDRKERRHLRSFLRLGCLVCVYRDRTQGMGEKMETKGEEEGGVVAELGSLEGGSLQMGGLSPRGKHWGRSLEDTPQSHSRYLWGCEVEPCYS